MANVPQVDAQRKNPNVLIPLCAADPAVLESQPDRSPEPASPARKRVGCVECRLIEPEPGTWVNGYCPRCEPPPKKKKQTQQDPGPGKPWSRTQRQEFREDLTGRTFGLLTVLGYAGPRTYAWNCRCACGREVVVKGGSLRYGETKSCGCFPKRRANLVGQTFGRLTVIGFAEVRSAPGRTGLSMRLRAHNHFQHIAVEARGNTFVWLLGAAAC
jgi:hypothetical protein